MFPEGHPRCEISSRMLDRSPDITRLLNKLVKEGLVKRTKSTDDMRQSIAVITPKGVNFLDELNHKLYDFSALFEQTVGEKDLNRIISICERILMMA